MAESKKTSRAAAGGVKILSFNIENFSEKKYQNQEVVNVLLEVRTISREQLTLVRLVAYASIDAS